jgi:cysteine desulfurase
MLKSLPFKGHLITTRVEHSAVYECVRSLESQGWQVTYLPVDLRGAPQIDQIEEAICQNTLAFVFSASNGETGAKLDWPSVATLAERHKILFLLDAVAYVGKEPLSDLKGVSAMAISGHKFHGPKGVGVLYHHPTFKLQASLLGGHQERGKRAGTENLDAIVGLAEAFAILKESQPAITEHLFQLRDRFERGLQQAVSDIVIHGLGPRVSNTSNVAFLGVDGETLLMQLDLAGIAASHGSACSAGALEPSRVLLQMGISKKEARSSLRFSFSRMNTIEEVDATVACCAQLVSAFK